MQNTHLQKACRLPRMALATGLLSLLPHGDSWELSPIFQSYSPATLHLENPLTDATDLKKTCSILQILFSFPHTPGATANSL